MEGTSLMFIVNFFKNLYYKWQRRRLIAKLRKQDPFIY